MYELIYTSVPKGLIPGRSGFATVAMSEGMPPNLIVPLENLSGYNFTLRDNTFLPILNPPSCYYIKMRYGNQQLHIAGRVAPNGLDYSQRNNKIAHHLLFESAEELENLSGGVAGLFFKPDMFRSEYTEEPMMLPFRKVPVCLQVGSLPARTWAELSGHAGFAAYTAERFRENPDKPLYLIYPAGTPCDVLLNLVMEVCALLNKNLRNYFTFSTYFGSSTASVDCFLRMVPDFSPLVSNLRRFHKNDIIELGQENDLPFTDNYPDIYECACTGKQPEFFQKTTEQSLTQHTIKILADSGLPPVPVKEMLKEEPVEITVPPPPPEGSYKKFVFAAAAAVIAAAIASLLLYDVPGKTKSPEKIKNNKPAVEAASVRIEKPQSGSQQPGQSAVSVLPAQKQAAQKPAAQKPATVKKVASGPARQPVKTTKPKHVLPEKPSRIQGSLFNTPALRINAAALPLQAAWSLFSEFNLASTSAQNIRVHLPKELHEAIEFYPVMHKIGTGEVNNSNFVEKNSHGTEVYIRAASTGVLPLQPVRGEITDVPHLMLKLSGDKKTLQASTYTGNRSDCIMPEFHRIGSIYFRTRNKVYVWKNQFDQNYTKLITPGTVIISGNDLLKYIPSKIEKSMLIFIRVNIGNYPLATFQTCSFYLKDWNQAVKFYRKSNEITSVLKKQLSAVAKTKAEPRSEKAIRAYMTELQAKANEGDMELVNNLFNTFLNEFFNVSEKTYVETVELKNFSEKLFASLTSHHLDPRKRRLLSAYNEKWKAKIAGLEKFQQNRAKLFAQYKKFDAVSEKIKTVGNRMLVTAGNIHPDIAKKLKAMMTAAGESWETTPSEIDTKKIAALSKAINKKINFEVVSPNMEGE